MATRERLHCSLHRLTAQVHFISITALKFSLCCSQTHISTPFGKALPSAGLLAQWLDKRRVNLAILVGYARTSCSGKDSNLKELMFYFPHPTCSGKYAWITDFCSQCYKASFVVYLLKNVYIAFFRRNFVSEKTICSSALWGGHISRSHLAVRFKALPS